MTTAALGEPIARDSGWEGKKAWAAGFFMSTLTVVLLFALADVYYPNNDDVFILRAFMGFQPSGPATFSPFQYPPMAWFLFAISRLIPKVAWFSVLQIVLLWLSNMVIVKSVVQGFARWNQPVWMGLLVSGCFTLLFAVRAGARVTFTVTSAMLAAAAVAQLMSVDMDHAVGKRHVAGIVGSFGLYTLAICLRMENLPVALATLGIALCYHAFRAWDGREPRLWRSKPLRKVGAVFMVLLLTAALLIGWNALDAQLQGESADAEWQRARMSVMDFLATERLPESLTADAGWSAAQVKQLQIWNTTDAVFSTEAFTQVANNAPASAKPTLREVLVPLYKKSLWALLAIATVGFLWVAMLRWAWMGEKRERYRLWIPVLLAGLLCAAMIGYLLLRRRMPERALLTAVLPVTTLLLCLLPQCMPRERMPARGRKHRVASSLLCALLLAPMIASVGLTVADVWRKPVKYEYHTYADMDQQALNHPDLLLFYERNLVGDVRMFPDVSKGMPTNLTFWGGWIRGTREYREKLAAFGLDANQFTAKDWLNPAVRLVSLKAEPSEAFMNYLRDQLGPDVTCQSEKVSAGLYFLRFASTALTAPLAQ